MCTLDKLGILGIRAFSPFQCERIKFGTPLTLIIGHNGAGKTTVVECLRMATTGEVPPGANKGQNFIHDPKLVNQPEVKGQIRLIFNIPNNHKVSLVRNLQLTYSKDKRGSKASFKALDCTVQTMDDKEQVIRTVSNKCVDMNQHIPYLMRVPKVVLESVIFCHQEDGGWPLGDPALLKKKFDDIFECSRYTKALDELEKVRKKLVKELADKETEKKLLRKDFETYQTHLRSIEKCKAKIETLNGDIKDLENKKGDLQQVLKRHEAQFEDLAFYEQKWSSLTQRIEEGQTKVQNIMSTLKDVYTESIADLLAIQETLNEEARVCQSVCVGVCVSQPCLSERAESSRECKC
eukprot:Blabericola_migrator_1__10326@NODE_580_length_7497_cov_126_900135_g430_i0_p3_GENE_NODE_580_length_7497_cov_126_900135_g430_i0NODE_580_length_7497_cov_126_900135_g430_i0_p3_ORF_typecomplete_len350_score86_17AAA_23/PF13476_6/3e32AAA_15/PF13175_6/3_2e12AAA_27/PF13514_6/6_2e08AAA_29/PF13555_6/7_8e07SMC_N/PF02463_19/2_1e06SMC_N/PF02463_19/1_8e03AAA_21/PF13304_6/1_3e05AAA_13/PF13166_6/3_3e05DUF2813/PF11398_8/5_5e05MAD/PF05557_13/9_6e05GAS/PF13851_6/0_00048ABC_tran/PF00005_27/0_001CENPF_leu_zip/PF10473